MSFKEKCEQFALGRNDLLTMLIHTKEREERGKIIIDHRWDFYLKKDEHYIPIGINLESRLQKRTGSIEIYYKHIAVCPTFEVYEFLQTFDDFIHVFLEKEIYGKDTEKIKRVVEGIVGGAKITHNKWYEDDWIIRKDALNIPLPQEKLEEFSNAFVYEQLSEMESPKNYEDVVLVVYGIKGKQLATMLEKRKLAIVHQADEQTFVIDFRFPFLPYSASQTAQYLRKSEVRELLVLANFSYKITLREKIYLSK